MDFEGDVIQKKLTTKQLIDSGSALVLILLILGFFTKNTFFYKLAIPALLVNMTIPKLYYPFEIFWYNLSNVLGFVVSRIILTIVFTLVVVPIGLLRNLIGNDTMDLKEFKKGQVIHSKIQGLHLFIERYCEPLLIEKNMCYGVYKTCGHF